MDSKVVEGGKNKIFHKLFLMGIFILMKMYENFEGL